MCYKDTLIASFKYQQSPDNKLYMNLTLQQTEVRFKSIRLMVKWKT